MFFNKLLCFVLFCFLFLIVLIGILEKERAAFCEQLTKNKYLEPREYALHLGLDLWYVGRQLGVAVA